MERFNVDVSAVAAFPSTPQVAFAAEPKTITITVEDAAGKDVAVSFDGVNVHVVMEAGSASAGLKFQGPAGKSRSVWLREGSSGNGAASVQVVGAR